MGHGDGSSPSAYFQGTVIAIGTFLIAVGGVPLIERGSGREIATLGILAAVLWAAVLGGGLAGGLAALAGTVVYAALRLPSFSDNPASALTATGMRMIAFAVVGLGGGILIGRSRRMLESVEKTGMRDPQTGAYSAAYMQQLLVLELEEHTRYSKPFAVVKIGATWERGDIARLARSLETSARASDTVGHFFDGGFIVILPHTDSEGASKASRRFASAVGGSGSEVRVRTYSAPENLPQLRKLVGKPGEESLTQAGDSGPA